MLFQRDPDAERVERELGANGFLARIRANPTWINEETGALVEMDVNFLLIDRFNPDTGIVCSTAIGSFFTSLRPGDQGPDGIVEESGALLSARGYQKVEIDAATGVFASFKQRGEATDLCAELS